MLSFMQLVCLGGAGDQGNTGMGRKVSFVYDLTRYPDGNVM